MPLPVQAEMAVLARGIVLHAAPYETLQLVQRVLGATRRTTPQQGAADPTWLIDGGRPVIGLEATPIGCVLSVHELAFLDSAPQGAQMWEWLRAQVETAAAAAGIPTSRRDRPLAQTQVIDPATSVWSAAPAHAVPAPPVPLAPPGPPPALPPQQAWPPTPSYAPAPGRGTGEKVGIALAVVVVGVVVLGILAAIAIPVFLNQRQQAELAEVRALTCQDVAATAVQQSLEDTTAGGVALVALNDAVVVADERSTIRVPAQGFQTFAMTCSGSAVWADGLETPMSVDVYIDSDLTPLLDATWDE